MGVIRWLYSSHNSIEGGQMAMLVSLLYGGGGEVWEPACPCVEGCHYREYTKRASGGQMAILVSLFYGGWSDGYTRLQRPTIHKVAGLLDLQYIK